MKQGSIRKAIFIGNHMPRQCGIATFTADLASAVRGAGIEVPVVAVNDRPEGYRYPEFVQFEVAQRRRPSYREAARFVNAQKPDVVCVQHEYGIYGGSAGAYLLTLLRDLKAPIITTLHTLLTEPNDEQRSVLSELLQLSERIVVMSNRGRSILKEVYGAKAPKVKVVPHGIPRVSRPVDAARLLGPVGREKTIILTFGLLGPDKGIENMILALPDIVKENPNVLYVVAGATHPHVLANKGEHYRESLARLARDLGVAQHVAFVNRFLSLGELTGLLQSATVYVTPYLKKEQITSGALAYAFGNAKAVVSTPYWHAEELLDKGRGILVPFRDPRALAVNINRLLGNPDLLREVQERAHQASLNMQWPAVGREYVGIFEEAREASIGILPSIAIGKPALPFEANRLPAFNPKHLVQMTDGTGMLQHAKFCVPNRFEGYCTDDNARAVILAVHMTGQDRRDLGEELQVKYLSFLHFAFDAPAGRMRNFMSYDRKWLERAGSEDSHGRAVWAFGEVAHSSWVPGVAALAADLFIKALPAVDGLSSPRTWCYALLGLDRFLASPLARSQDAEVRDKLAKRLNSMYRSISRPGWCWFEDGLYYDNARMAQALLLAGKAAGNEEMTSNALEALDWLVHIQTDDSGRFLPIGSNGFFRKGDRKARFDQQPIEASATVSAALSAYQVTGESRWLAEASRAFDWFCGANSAQRPVYDAARGGCRDAVTPDGLNENQGAESTLAFLDALLAMERVQRGPVHTSAPVTLR